MDKPSQQILFTILHFNDVYDIQPNKEGKWGAVNYEALMTKFKKQYPKHIVLFSGDCFSPSILTNIFDGEHMVTALNMFGIDFACYGNHQFDLHPDRTVSLAQSCNFPWLLGNIKYKGSDFVLGNGTPYIVKEYFGIRIGFFGVAGQDWLGILSQQYQNQLQYIDVESYSKQISKKLLQKEKCQMVIALTHMRSYQDKKLPLAAPDIDIILGGHDHIVMKQFINQIPVIKNGDNFKCLGVTHVYAKNKNPSAVYKGRRFDFDVQQIQVPIAVQNVNEKLKNYVQFCVQKYKNSDHIVGFTEVPLETRFNIIRSQQTNFGNFVTDLIRSYYNVDICLLNAGSIRYDLLIPPGELKYSLISNLINNVNIVKQVSGQVLLQALQYSISALPGFGGGFPLISGVRFSFDMNKIPRIQQVYVNEEPLSLDRNYSLATHMYIASGGDGFEMFKPCKILVDCFGGIDTLRLLLKFFKGLVNYENENKETVEIDNLQQLSLSRKVSARTQRIGKYKGKIIIDKQGQKYVTIAPKLDGRIRCLNN